MPQIIEITDLTRPELDVFCRLTEAQLRNRLEPEKGVFIAESPTVIGLALDAGYEPLALLTERKFIEGKAAGIIARCGEIPLYTGEREVLARLTGYELTRGVLCAMRRPSPKDFREVCAGTRRVAVLENVVDSTNVGAIIRSAAALGIDAVLLTPSCCDPLNRRAVRVSMGTVFQIPWAYIGEQPADWPSSGLDWPPQHSGNPPRAASGSERCSHSQLSCGLSVRCPRSPTQWPALVPPPAPHHQWKPNPPAGPSPLC